MLWMKWEGRKWKEEWKLKLFGWDKRGCKKYEMV